MAVKSKDVSLHIFFVFFMNEQYTVGLAYNKFIVISFPFLCVFMLE